MAMFVLTVSVVIRCSPAWGFSLNGAGKEPCNEAGGRDGGEERKREVFLEKGCICAVIIT